MTTTESHQKFPTPRLEVQRYGEVVILQGLALRDVRALVKRGIRQAQREDGISPHERLQQLVNAFDQAIAHNAFMSPNGQNDVANNTTMGQSETEEQHDVIGTTEAAKILQLSARQVQRKARSLGGHRTGGRWRYNRTDVEHYKSNRQET